MFFNSYLKVNLPTQIYCNRTSCSEQIKFITKDTKAKYTNITIICDEY